MQCYYNMLMDAITYAHMQVNQNCAMARPGFVVFICEKIATARKFLFLEMWHDVTSCTTLHMYNK